MGGVASMDLGERNWNCCGGNAGRYCEDTESGPAPRTQSWRWAFLLQLASASALAIHLTTAVFLLLTPKTIGFTAGIFSKLLVFMELINKFSIILLGSTAQRPASA